MFSLNPFTSYELSSSHIFIAVTTLCLGLATTIYIQLQLKQTSPSIKNVVITGASTGIGEKLAYIYATRKSHLLLIALEQDLLQQVRENCLRLGASSVEIFKADLTADESYSFLSKALDRKPIDILHLNHGMLENRFFMDYERGRNWERFQKVLKCNYESHVRILSLAISRLLSNPDGAVVAVTCSGGVAGPLPFDGGYVAAKSALCAYFTNLRQELKLLGSSVKVTIMFPGAIDTSFVRPHSGLRRQAVSADKLAQRFVKAVDRREKNVYFPANVRIAFWLSYLFPKMYNKVVCSIKYLPNRPDCLGRLNEMRETIANIFRLTNAI